MTVSGQRVDTALLDRIDEAAEQFSSALTREHYLNYAGLKDELSIEPLYEAFGWLFTEDLARSLLHGEGDDPRLPNLRAFVVSGYLEEAVQDLTEAIAARETRDSIHWNGEEVPYRSVARLIANEGDAARRHRLDRLRLEAVASQNILRERRWLTLHARTRNLGYPTYASLMDRVRDLGLAGLRRLVEDLLDRTEGAYRGQLGAYLSGIGVKPSEAERSDLSALFRASRFDAHFTRERLIPAYRATLQDLGIDPEAQSNVHLDTEERPRKSPRAFCAPVRIPAEIYLVISPQGGQDDYRAMLHEGGHAEHFAHVRPDLPYAFRGLGDNSVTEGFAFTLEHVVHEPGWLERHLGFPDPSEYLRFVRFHKLYMLRRYASKLLYELALHGGDDPRAKAKVYADLLTTHLGVRWSPVDYLADVDDGLYVAQYLRAWILDAQLRRHLRERFGPEWHRSAAAGDVLKDLWSRGQREPAHRLVRRTGAPGLQIDPLLEEILP